MIFLVFQGWGQAWVGLECQMEGRFESTVKNIQRPLWAIREEAGRVVQKLGVLTAYGI